MNIVPKTVTLTPAVTIDLTEVNITDVKYNNKMRRCVVTYNNIYTLVFAGAEYDALGQWDDASLLAAVMAKLGVVAAA